MNRIIWIDTIRGICMIAILLFHTEIYYSNSEIIPYSFYTSNALIIFYFVSGYLFCRDHTFNLKHKLISIVKNLIVPYIIFTLLIALPKAYLHNNDISTLLINIILGKASWFIASLVLSEFCFSILLFFNERFCQYILPICCTLLFIFSIFINFNYIGIWNYNISAMSMIYLYMGYLYHQKENLFEYMNHKFYIIIFGIILVFIKYVEYNHHISIMICPLIINNYSIFFIDSITSIIFMIGICKQIPEFRILTYTGAHSIVYYFLCGGAPLITSIILNKIHFGYNGQYYRVIIALMIGYVIASFFTWIIYKYLPWITGKQIKNR